jgi:hypothetical protein
MSSTDERVQIIEDKLNDVSQRVEKIEEKILELKSGFRDVDVVEEKKEIIETPTPTNPRDSPSDSRNSEYNGSQPIVQTQLDSIRPNKKPNGQQVSSIQGKIRIRLDYLKNAGTPETDDEVIMLNDVLKGKFRGGRRTRRMRKRITTRRILKSNRKTRSHKKRH